MILYNSPYNFVNNHKFLDLLELGSSKAILANLSKRPDVSHCLVSALHAACGKTIFHALLYCCSLPGPPLPLIKIQEILTTKYTITPYHKVGYSPCS